MDLERIQVDPLYENYLDMESFANMLQSPSQSYKFYWLEAILTLLPERDTLSFREIIDEMIWEAWYTVTQYHLHLGPPREGRSENYIEHAIHLLAEDAGTRLSMNRERLRQLLTQHRREIDRDYQGLITNVPYRLLSSFLKEIGGKDRIWNQKKKLIDYCTEYNKKTALPYTFDDGQGLQRRIILHPAWKQVMLDNYAVIRSWIQMKKVRFLQDRNPGVPGIIYKLETEEDRQRQLARVKTLWLCYGETLHAPIIDIYSGTSLAQKSLSIDHFIPWSFISNDEIWNLTPMDRAENSSKGNRLPDWNRFFPALAENQYRLYRGIQDSDVLHEQFDKCRNTNLNAVWAAEQLYIPGHTRTRFGRILEHHLKPLYETARLQGFSTWQFDERVT
ncbi:MAG: HNH endonuclease domain-containing protein [Anaerovoracaceae bacterium]|jgi:hypothetical protein